MKSKILEIFRSVQGEGRYAGCPHVFVRFFGCNMDCAWCDTPLSIPRTGPGRFREMRTADVVDEVASLSAGARAVSLTGGEPLLQKGFIEALLIPLRETGLKVHLDTNGVCPDALDGVIDGIDTVAMDVKLPSSTGCRPFWEEHERFLRIARRREVFVKMVIASGTTRLDVEHAAGLIAGVDRGIEVFIQPNYMDMKDGLIPKCVEFQNTCLKRLDRVRLLPQVHKFMKLP